MGNNVFWILSLILFWVGKISYTFSQTIYVPLVYTFITHSHLSDEATFANFPFFWWMRKSELVKNVQVRNHRLRTFVVKKSQRVFNKQPLVSPTCLYLMWQKMLIWHFQMNTHHFLPKNTLTHCCRLSPEQTSKHCCGNIINVFLFAHPGKHFCGNKICFSGSKNLSQQIQKYFGATSYVSKFFFQVFHMFPA